MNLIFRSVDRGNIRVDCTFDDLALALDESYEEGQDDLICEVLEKFDQYSALEERRIELFRKMMASQGDTDTEIEFDFLTKEENFVERELMEIFGEDTRIFRQGRNICMTIGSVSNLRG